MDQPSLESLLADLNLPAIRYFKTIGSTNDEAKQWVLAGGPDRALVIADEQIAGRGRKKRRWITISESGLAFSIILRSPPLETRFASRLTGLGALAVRDALAKYALKAQIKWPNDILLDQRKAAGILTEVSWIGETLLGAIIGIGINIAPQSISQDNLPEEGLNFPVTCIEKALGHPINRWELLHVILQRFYYWLPQMATPDFIREWENGLAYLGQWVELTREDEPFLVHPESAPLPNEVGKVLGLTSDGGLKLLTKNGKIVTARVGEIRLRPT